MYKVSCAELRLCSALSVSLRSSGLIVGGSRCRNFEKDIGRRKDILEPEQPEILYLTYLVSNLRCSLPQGKKRDEVTVPSKDENQDFRNDSQGRV
jgi:hypothetical protein